MAERIHIVVGSQEKERFRRLAQREGKSLSEWLRAAAHDRAAAAAEAPLLDSLESLREFFRECDRRESGVEPDWADHRKVIEQSVGRGAAPS